MQFTDVIGQEILKRELPELMQENRLAHAILFLGKEGSGALPLALSFAQYIVCEKVNGQKSMVNAGPSLFGDEPAPAGQTTLTDSCGTCPACLKAAAFAHPDIHFSYPVVTKKSGTPPISTDYIAEWREFLKGYPYGNAYDWLQFIGAENKQGNITAQECNDIIKKLNLKSFESEYKILILWLPEYLGNEGNKLLKLIEEPPPNTVFLFVAENESQILGTILSRVQLIKVPLLEDKDMETALIERNKTSPETAARIAAVSQGNYHTALQMAQHADEDWQELLRDWLNAIMKTGPVAQTRWVDESSKLGREKQKQFLLYFNHLLQLAIKIQVFNKAEAGYPEKDVDFAVRLNRISSLEQQQAIIEELDNAAYYIERNANSKMLFMALTIKIYHVIRDKIVFLNE
ncbi:DNA polymerase III subunit [Niabella soli]|uniref:DNA polymerase III subunit gamma/tau n=1 Tax=Niabella soli DSM 19437 TaxID=929713 RepID=W0F008_9BACT|nr:DNA polymerase III subunit delta' [Niabella soli]AHF16347.1 DNA polymerase III subunit gamma/tau [Niabella soli DSM 19437]